MRPKNLAMPLESNLSVVERTQKPPGDVIMQMQDDDWELTKTTGGFAELVDNPDRDDAVKMLVGVGPGGATLIVPSNQPTRSFFNNLGKELDINIKRPAGDREPKPQAKSTDFRDDKNVVQ